MKSNLSVKAISLCGLFTALAVLFQSAPVFLSSPGMMLSPLSTLPVAVLSYLSPAMGLMAYISSALILFMISPQEAIIFLLATGALGFMLGAFKKKGVMLTGLVSSLTLWMGVLIMTYIVGIPSFGSLTQQMTFFTGFLFILVFSVIYCAIWQIFFSFFVKLLARLKIIDNYRNT